MTTTNFQNGTSVTNHSLLIVGEARRRLAHASLVSTTCSTDAVHKRRFVVKAIMLLVLLAGAAWALPKFSSMPLWLFKLLLFVYGWFVYTIFEYCYHRFIVHGGKGTKELSVTADQEQLPGPVARIITTLVSAVSIWLAFSEQPLYTPIAGFVNGISFSCYCRIFLQWEGFSKLSPALYRNRLYHTSGGTDKAFGWSTVVWDKYFDTYVPSGIVHTRQPGNPPDAISAV